MHFCLYESPSCFTIGTALTEEGQKENFSVKLLLMLKLSSFIAPTFSGTGSNGLCKSFVIVDVVQIILVEDSGIQILSRLFLRIPGFDQELLADYR